MTVGDRPTSHEHDAGGGREQHEQRQGERTGAAHRDRGVLRRVLGRLDGRGHAVPQVDPLRRGRDKISVRYPTE